MDAIRTYIDGIEAQVSRDGFMTHALRRHLHQLGRLSADIETGRRIDRLVARYNLRYAFQGDMATVGNA